MDDSRGFSTSNAVEEASLYVGGMDSFEMSDRYLTHGCQWYVDPTNPGSNRFLYNDENADVPKFNNERDTVNTECNDPGLWCYPTYSHRVCGGLAPKLSTAAVIFLPILLLVAAFVLWKKTSVGADGEALVIEGGKVLPSPASPSRKSMAERQARLDSDGGKSPKRLPAAMV
mmetsp:Transcript_52776/g.126604  ORF Transcript_52776/g.126604 Transcript_52776/m.126604 type:complete len:172 (+) Transcript_52776:1-516(+)